MRIINHGLGNVLVVNDDDLRDPDQVRWEAYDAHAYIDVGSHRIFRLAHERDESRIREVGNRGKIVLV